MDEPEIQIHSFVIKLWLEEMDEKTGQAIWRGHITHVASGEHRYLKNLADITLFIVPYLENIGIQFGLGQRIKRWLKARWLY